VTRKTERKSRYFGRVARFFLERRGAPLFLSSAELDCLARWEAAGIPLTVVIEGVRECVESRRSRPGSRRKPLSLCTCRPFVQKAFEAYRERRVGTRTASPPEEKRRSRLIRAVRLFLDTCPRNLAEIREVYARLVNTIPRETDEERLEELEAEVESLLLARASEEEKRRIRELAAAEFGPGSGVVEEEIFERRLIQHLREKYRVPHIPFYYY